jgi:glutamate-1-semialdehyde 2,1-aminomutase
MAQVRDEALQAQWAARRTKSAALAERARQIFPSGVTHDSRYLEPFPIYVTHAKGARKWDVDGNEYVDYWMGHGALLLGHNHPSVLQASSEQLAKGTHFGACHELEVAWGELVQQIVPSAERVKFTSSGTEATMLAMRLARAFTGKDKIVKIQGHFHGWHDYAAVAMEPPYDEPISRGIPKAVQNTVLSVPFKDVNALRAILDAHHPEVAGLILLAGGAGTEYLQDVRELTRERGIVLIFDEVVTGFRYAPGGCQEYYGVTPDLTTLAKILAGGLPGGAVAGRADILALFESRDDPQWQRFGRIRHPGTFNANPVSAAAGIACLNVVRSGEPQKQAIRTAERLQRAFQEILDQRGVHGIMSADASILALRLTDGKVSDRELTRRLRIALQVGGVDFDGASFKVSAVHDEADVQQTIAAFTQAIELLGKDGA